MWNDSEPLTIKWIEDYKIKYNNIALSRKDSPGYNRRIIEPTPMQAEAISSIERMRLLPKPNGEPNRALLISATGTGKTYISAFAVKESKAQKVLFVVHRGKILKDALDSYKNVLGENGRQYGIFKGVQKERNVDCLFASSPTLARHLNDFNPYEFDYIVFDEVHHIASSEQLRILQYFKPKFVLGMTATPERTRNKESVFEIFYYNIAYEVRLSKALEDDLVCPFHYFGISDLTINGKQYPYKDFYHLPIENKIEALVDEIQSHPYSGERVRGLIFCSSVAEAYELEKAFTEHSQYKVKTLTKDDSEETRQMYFDLLLNDERKLDFIISKDILNEGIDLPKVNEIILLRHTSSSIVFIQQLGRGLRKIDGKEFTTVLDFVGDYENNYKIPIALFGDSTCNKENLKRKTMLGNNVIPGPSVIHFDPIAKDLILKSINSGRVSYIKELKESYLNAAAKYKEDPTLCQLYEEGGLDPRAIIERSKSLNEFKKEIHYGTIIDFTKTETDYLNSISNLVVNGQRCHECIILKEILEYGYADLDNIQSDAERHYHLTTNKNEIINNSKTMTEDLSFFSSQICTIDKNKIIPTKQFSDLLINEKFKKSIDDAISCGLIIYEKEYHNNTDEFGFALYRLYTRADFCRITNKKKTNESTIYGYKKLGGYCPLFITYKKTEGNPLYSDHFIDNSTIYWESRYPRCVNSDELQPIINCDSNGLVVLIFIQKDDNDGKDFYYCGRAHPNKSTVQNAKTYDKKGKEQDVVSIEFKLDTPVREDIFEYITNDK